MRREILSKDIFNKTHYHDIVKIHTRNQPSACVCVDRRSNDQMMLEKRKRDEVNMEEEKK